MEKGAREGWFGVGNDAKAWYGGGSASSSKLVRPVLQFGGRAFLSAALEIWLVGWACLSPRARDDDASSSCSLAALPIFHNLEKLFSEL
jgi:hypothetical protein